MYSCNLSFTTNFSVKTHIQDVLIFFKSIISILYFPENFLSVFKDLASFTGFGGGCGQHP